MGERSEAFPLKREEIKHVVMIDSFEFAALSAHIEASSFIRPRSFLDLS